MSDISTHYGGSMLAMTGADSIILAGDKRLGLSSLTINTERSSIYRINSKCLLGLTGFIPDVQCLLEITRTQVKLFEITEERDITLHELQKLVSYILYSYRTKGALYVSPIVAGLSEDGTPTTMGMDCLGCASTYQYVTAGTAANNLTGICQALWSDGMDREQLFTNAMQAFLNAVDRDALSGWGAECYIVSREGITRREVEGRND